MDTTTRKGLEKMKKSEITYSYTKAKMLDECERKYYLTYHEAVGGWRQEASQACKTAFKLKKLQPLQSLIGTAVHDAISSVVTKGDIHTPAEFTKAVFRSTRTTVNESRARLAEYNYSQGNIDMVQEIYYNNTIEPLRDVVAEKIRTCSRNFFVSKSFVELTSNPSIFTIDTLEKIPFDDFVAFVKIDAFYKNDDGKIIVVDWKTGKANSNDVLQLLLYVYFVVCFSGIMVENIEARLEYLYEGRCETHYFSQKDIDKADQIVRDHLYQMRMYLVDEESNTPLSRAVFRKNESPRCNSCNYLEMCNKEAFLMQRKKQLLYPSA